MACKLGEQLLAERDILRAHITELEMQFKESVRLGMDYCVEIEEQKVRIAELEEQLSAAEQALDLERRVTIDAVPILEAELTHYRDHDEDGDPLHCRVCHPTLEDERNVYKRTR